MKLFDSAVFRKYLLPGFVFQSVVIAGGYGTGREIVEYFLNYGPLGGLLGMILIATVIWSLTLALSFEFARLFKAYDYRSFFKVLLGKYWFLFEIIYLYGMLLILAVVGSAAGVLIRDNFGVDYIAGVIIMFIVVGLLTFKGSRSIEKFLAGWSFILYAVYAVILVVTLTHFGPVIKDSFLTYEAKPGWLMGGFKYALYNINVIPAVMFCLTHIETRKEAVTAGLLGGVIAMFPGLLFFIAIVSQYPAVLPEEIPIMYLLDKIDIKWLIIVFQIVLFGTLIETGTGLIHAFNERIQGAYKAKNKKFPRKMRPMVAVVLLVIGMGIASFGLITLIAKGYTSLSWGVFAVYMIPVFTLGIYKIVKNK